MHSLRVPVLLLFTHILAKAEVTNPVVDQNPACPQVGTYFRWLRASLLAASEQCHLCFCRETTAAHCWPREDMRCGNVSQDAVGRKPRSRRSFLGLSNLFLGGAASQFFKEEPKKKQECVPNTSASDGCPPADWCLGCTVCDCDNYGQWNCRILSFCSGGETKKRQNGSKVPVPKNIANRITQNNKSTKPPKKAKKSMKKPAKKFQPTTIKPNAQTKRQQQKTKPKRVTMKPKLKHLDKRKVKKTIYKPKPSKKPDLKKRIPTQTIVQKTTTEKAIGETTKLENRPRNKTKTQIRKVIRRVLSKRESIPDLKDLANMMDTEENNNQTLMGRKIVKTVLSTVEKMLGKQAKLLQNQVMLRSQLSKDCPQVKTAMQNKVRPTQNTRRELTYEEMKERRRKAYINRNSWREKREALDLDELSVIQIKDRNSEVTDDLAVKKLQKQDTGNNFVPNITDATLIQASNFTDATLLNISDVTKINSNFSNTTTEKTVTAYLSQELNSNVTSIQIHENMFGNNDESTSYTVNIDKTTSTDVTANNYNSTQKSPNNVTNFNTSYVNHKNNEETVLIKHIMYTMTQENKKNKLKRKDDPRKVPNKYFKVIAVNNITDHSSSSVNDAPTINKNRIRIQNILKNIQKNQVKLSAIKPKNSVFKYLRNIFNYISLRNIDNSIHKTNEGYYTLKVLCDNIRACFTKEHNRVALRSKLHDLNSETEKVFKSIKIIKGLLHVIDFPIIVNDTTKNNLNTNIKKLNAILKGTYYNNRSLSETEELQIRYVKENIHNFIVSVGKFASILHDVLDEINKHNKTYSSKRTLRLNKKANTQNVLNKVKKLLIKYNIVHNKFMKRIFQLVTNAVNDTSYKSFIKSENIIKNATGIDTYTTDLVKHLSKLKSLAQAINSTRKKRMTMIDSSAMEYMLLMMEYLIKQKRTLALPPAYDGIDVLIDAIQNAPDIKPVKNKVLATKPIISAITNATKNPIFMTRHTSYESSNLKEVDNRQVDSSNYDYNNKRVQYDAKDEIKEDSGTSDNVSIIGIDRDDIDEGNIESIYNRGIQKNGLKPDQNDYLNKDEADIIQSSNVGNGPEGKLVFDTFKMSINKPDKDKTISNEDKADYPQVSRTTALKVVRTTVMPWEDSKQEADPVTITQNSLVWIEDTDKETNVVEMDNLHSTVKPHRTTQVVPTPSPDRIIDNISVITAEVEDELNKVRFRAAKRKKGMKLLNPLEYGSEKLEFDDDSVSKDDEKSYFSL